jgi:hypothetical protein
MRNTIVFNGVKYRRYPQAKHQTSRNYYHSTTVPRRKLHVEIWRATYGEVPKGAVVHHKDGDPLNNDIHNLELLTRAQHQKHHCQERLNKNPGFYSYAAENLREAHKRSRSRKGRKALSRRVQAFWDAKPTLTKECLSCGKTFETKNQVRKYCEKNCRFKVRY